MSRLKIATIVLTLTGGAFAMSWFGSGEVSWDDYNAAVRKGLPRSATNVLEKIERKAMGIGGAVRAMKKSAKKPPKQAAFALMSAGLGRTHARRVKKFAASEACVGCGVCEKVCPRNNIQLRGGRPVFGPNCIGCLSCVQYCPKSAINIGKVTEKRERFPEPTVKASDLTQKIIHID